MTELTPIQIEHIIETWKIIAENYFDSGEYILYRFFEKHQHYQTRFKKFKYTPLEELKVIIFIFRRIKEYGSNLEIVKQINFILIRKGETPTTTVISIKFKA